MRLLGWTAPGGSEELVVAYGPADSACRLLILPAWFDEANKTRHFTVETMRALERGGVASVLPDLPGCNESTAPLPTQDLASWRAAAGAAAAAFGSTHVLAIRGAANIAPALPGFAYAPLAGKSALRALLRARVLAAREAGREETTDGLLGAGMAGGLELAGYHLGAGMIGDLAAADLPANTLVPLSPGGPGLWLRAEPDHDPAQAERLAGMILAGLAQ